MSGTTIDTPALFRRALHGIPHRYVDRWDHPGISGKGLYDLRHGYVMLHHTAIPASADRRGGTSLNFIKNDAGQWAPVRRANLLIDREGVVWIMSAFVAYHAGAGGPYLDVPADMMNLRSVGIEVESPGLTRDFTRAQKRAVTRVSAAFLSEMDSPLNHVLNHRTWRRSKVDTLYSDAYWRERVANRIDRMEDGVSTPAYRSYSGKTIEPVSVIGDGNWHDIPNTAVKGSPFARPHEEHTLYARTRLVWDGASAIITIRYVRDDGDATAYREYEPTADNTSLPIEMTHFEVGSKGVGGKWQIRIEGGVEEAIFTTRYAKLHAIDVDWQS